MQPIRILPVIPTMEDATSYYRGQLPVSNLFRDYDVNLVYVTEIKWSTMSMADVLFLQRPFDPKHVIMAQVAQKLGKKVWCDWDDDLFTVPESNRTHGFYADENVRRAVAELAAMADAVTVSTRVLANRMNDIRRRAEKPEALVIPNALDEALIPKRGEPDKTRRPLIMWRGSDTHQHDLMTVTEELLHVFHENHEFTAHFLGYNPFWITQGIRKNQCIVGAPIDILDYHKYLTDIQPGILVVPLWDCEFNRAKSNIAWIEATYGFAQVVAPDFEEWRMPGVLNYKDGPSFKRQLLRAMREVKANDWTRVRQSWDHITSTLTLGLTNEKRWELVQSLCPGKSVAKRNTYKGEGSEVESYLVHLNAVQPGSECDADEAREGAEAGQGEVPRDVEEGRAPSEA